MRTYSNKIALIKNARGIYSLDTIIGCNSGMTNEIGGCYNDCYAAKSAKLYGYDFSKNVLRYFENEKHRFKIINEINKVKLDFIRIGTSGDPSENWDHTINIIKQIENCNKEIVIITKHWYNLNNDQLDYLSKINVCINTSVSALDRPDILNNSLKQYNLLKKYCKSILRIVSCDFNKENETGLKYSIIQNELFKNENVLDTILRVNKNNSYLKKGIIKVEKTKFLGKNTLASKFKKNTYFNKCSTCKEMCGVNIESKSQEYPVKKGILKQLNLFKK